MIKALKVLRKHYEMVLFTAASAPYAELVLQSFDGHQYFDHIVVFSVSQLSAFQNLICSCQNLNLCLPSMPSYLSESRIYQGPVYIAGEAGSWGYHNCR